MAIVLILAPLLITSVMSSSDSIIEGALISVGGKNKTFLPIFTSFFLSDSLMLHIFFLNVILLYSPPSCLIEFVEECTDCWFILSTPRGSILTAEHFPFGVFKSYVAFFLSRFHFIKHQLHVHKANLMI